MSQCCLRNRFATRRQARPPTDWLVALVILASVCRWGEPLSWQETLISALAAALLSAPITAGGGGLDWSDARYRFPFGW
jgi:hypothetical protein